MDVSTVVVVSCTESSQNYAMHETFVHQKFIYFLHSMIWMIIEHDEMENMKEN